MSPRDQARIDALGTILETAWRDFEGCSNAASAVGLELHELAVSGEVCESSSAFFEEIERCEELEGGPTIAARALALMNTHERHNAGAHVAALRILEAAQAIMRLARDGAAAGEAEGNRS